MKVDDPNQKTKKNPSQPKPNGFKQMAIKWKKTILKSKNKKKTITD